MDIENPRVKILMFPWLAYGHISPFLELAKKLSDKNFHTYLCSTPANLSSIKNKIPAKYSVSIQLVELHLPSSPELPPHHHTTNGLPLHLNRALRKALQMAKPNLSDILKNLKPDLFIHDVSIQWATGFAFSHDIPEVSFLTSGAAMCSYFCHFLMNPPGVEYPFPSIKLTNFEHDIINVHVEFVKSDRKERTNTNDDEVVDLGAGQTMLIKSSTIIEGKYMDYLSQLMRRKIVPLGPLFLNRDFGGDDEENCELMEWLGTKDELSTVYLSFGSEYFLKNEEIEEIAYALELISDVNFIWVVRFPTGEKQKIRVEDVLPLGFLNRVGERGKIVEKWAPQAKILGHSSVGGFVSHCGWSSLMESVEFGVPIIAMPMHLDQPINAKLVVELGVGVEVMRDEKGKFRREEIGSVIIDVLIGESGEGLRGKVRECRENLRGKGEEEINGLVLELAQLGKF